MEGYGFWVADDEVSFYSSCQLLLIIQRGAGMNGRLEVWLVVQRLRPCKLLAGC
jgi:hypothetical protein